MNRSVSNSIQDLDKTLILLSQDKSIPITLFVGSFHEHVDPLQWHRAINVGKDEISRNKVISLLKHIADDLENRWLEEDTE
jgi:hypothetical protein